MSRSDYVEGITGQELTMYRGAVASSIRGARGQAMLRELATALDAMPRRELVDGDLIQFDGAVCALGALAVARGTAEAARMLDATNYRAVARLFGVAPALVREIAYENDTEWRPETPEQRWTRVRQWVASHIKEPT